MTNIMTNIVLYCIVLYCIVFYCIVLYCYLKSITYFCLQTTGLIYHVTGHTQLKLGNIQGYTPILKLHISCDKSIFLN